MLLRGSLTLGVACVGGIILDLGGNEGVNLAWGIWKMTNNQDKIHAFYINLPLTIERNIDNSYL